MLRSPSRQSPREANIYKDRTITGRRSQNATIQHAGCGGTKNELVLWLGGSGRVFVTKSYVQHSVRISDFRELGTCEDAQAACGNPTIIGSLQARTLSSGRKGTLVFTNVLAVLPLLERIWVCHLSGMLSVLKLLISARSVRNLPFPPINLHVTMPPLHTPQGQIWSAVITAKPLHTHS